MKRAAVLIGVDKTGDLPKLKDAARGAQLMASWAQAQGMDPVHLITDAQGPVTIAQIRKVIRDMVDAANVGQLVIYFAGHGVNLQRQEYWLLTDAPDDTQAAVNVATSVALAATCGIPHVVLVSDACRTAPEGIRAQSMRGSEIFPNREADTTPVDQFFACQLGKPSHEVRDAAVTSAEFQALYTHELVPALLGQRAQIIDWSGEGAARQGLIHLRPLRDFMASAVSTRLEGLQLQSKVIQVPMAQISSDPPSWISQLKADAAAPLGPATRGRPRLRGTPMATTAAASRVLTPASMTTQLLHAAMGGVAGVPSVQPSAIPPAASAPSSLPRLRGRPVAVVRTNSADSAADSAAAPAMNGLAQAAHELAQPFGPMSHETACGFKLRGARVVEVVAPGVHTEFVTYHIPAGEDIRVFNPRHPGSNVLLVLESGAGVLLPAIPEFLCALSFDDDELIDVAYEPSDNTQRWAAYQGQATEIRALRAIASAASACGSFQLEGDDALAIARRMQVAKGLDPSLAVYAAYAYHALQRPDLIRQMASYLQGDLGAPLFDVALLARSLDKHKLSGNEPLLAPLPLMAQGWTLLQAYGVTLPSPLQPLMGLRLPSLWTLFNPRGVACLRHAFTQGALQ